MTAKMTGGLDLQAFLASLPANIERNVLRGALKAGADEIAEGARENCRSHEVRATIQTTARSEKGLVTAKVQTKGEGAYKAPWFPNGDKRYFQGRVFGAQETPGSATNVLMITSTVEINTKVIKADAA